MSSKCFSTSCGEMRHEPRLRTTSVAIGYSQREELSHQHTICSVLGIPRGRPSWRRKSRLLKFLVSIPFFFVFLEFHVTHILKAAMIDCFCFSS